MVTPLVLDALNTSNSISEACIIVVSVDQYHICVPWGCSTDLRCHICMCHRAEGVKLKSQGILKHEVCTSYIETDWIEDTLSSQ